MLDITKETAWSTKKSIKIAVISFLIGLIIFLFAYIGMTQNVGIGMYNQPVLSWMVEHRDSFITTIMQLITSAANPMIIASAIVAIAAAWGFVKREIWRPILLISIVVSTAVISTIIKSATANIRPPQIDMITPLELDYSFPSGHTIIIVISLLLIGYLICSRHSNTRRIYIWAGVATLGIAIIAISRLYLGYHWITDVAASIGLGFMIFAMAITIDVIVTTKAKKLK